jgi:hypothetical protein
MVDVHKYRKKNMCNKWDEDELIYKDCKIKLQTQKNGGISVTGTLDLSLLGKYNNMYVKFWAPSSADSGQSFNSSLPFPSKEMAYDNSPNVGAVMIQGNSFTFYIKQPNSYYANMGTTYVEPEVRFRLYDSKNKRITNIYIVKISKGVAFRALNFHYKQSPEFYNNDIMEIKTQAQTLRDSSYNYNKDKRKSFWNKKPAM